MANEDEVKPIIQVLKEYLLDSGLLLDGAEFEIDFLSPDNTSYALVGQAGETVLEWYINDGSSRQFAFALQSTESNADELARIEASGFYETLSAWFETQTRAGTLPELGSGKKATGIETTGQPFVFQEGQSGTGVYQVPCRLLYEQDPPSAA